MAELPWGELEKRRDVYGGTGLLTIWLFSKGSSISFRLAKWRISEQIRSAVAPSAQTALATRRSTYAWLIEGWGYW